MNLTSTVLKFFFYLVVPLGILVFVHELGHFLAARLFRVRVEVFSLGFGLRLVGFKRKDTDYRISLIPLGGYVRMVGEPTNEDQPAPDDPGSLLAKPRWQRLLVMLAGPSMNILVALLLWWGLFMSGFDVLDIPQGPPVVERVEPDSPAAKAGIEQGDQILAIAGRTIRTTEDYGNAVFLRPGQTLTYTLGRGDRTIEKQVTLATNPLYGVAWDGVRPRIPIVVETVLPNGPAARAGVLPGDRILAVDGHVPGDPTAVSKLIEAGGAQVSLSLLRGGQETVLKVSPESLAGARRIGVALNYPHRFVRYGPVLAARESLREGWSKGGVLFRALSALITRQVGLSVMSGPLEIARISQEQAQLGLGPLLGLLAFISIQLGIINLFPIPVLDGGHILILLVESIIRRDVSTTIKERLLQAGFVLLVVFAAAVIVMDVRKFISRASAPGDRPQPATGAAAPRAPAAPPPAAPR